MLLLIPLLPFAGFLINASFGRRLPKTVSGGIACVVMVAAFLVSLAATWPFLLLVHDAHPVEQVVFNWISSGTLQVPFALRLDQLSSLMLMVITGIGSLIHIYSIGYMHEETDSEYARYFCVPESLRLLHARARARRQLPADVHRLGGRRPLFVPADWLLSHEAVGIGRRQEGVCRQPHRRLRLHPGDAADFRDLRYAGLPGRGRGRGAARARDARHGRHDDRNAAALCRRHG